MATNNIIHPKRVLLTDEDLEQISKDELVARWKQQNDYIQLLESQKKPTIETGCVVESGSEEKRKQQIEASHRENILVMRLTTKEQEMQEYLNQIQELKQAQNSSTAQLRSMLLDPAVNIMYQKMRKELDETKQKLEQTQNEFSAWKFTPDSQTGKRLMAKCRMLLQENDELGKVVSSGRIAKLEGDIALEKTLVQEMKKSQAEIDEFLVELDEDVEGMQSTIYILQQQLKEAREEINKLQKQNEFLNSQQQQQQTGLQCASDDCEPAAGTTGAATIEPTRTEIKHELMDVTDDTAITTATRRENGGFWEHTESQNGNNEQINGQIIPHLPQTVSSSNNLTTSITTTLTKQHHQLQQQHQVVSDVELNDVTAAAAAATTITVAVAADISSPESQHSYSSPVKPILVDDSDTDYRTTGDDDVLLNGLEQTPSPMEEQS
ncbi:pre-mRNA-splicing regulator WTAP-like [Tubulanus polymorphus]|uniref:pre-mRNA-splicing regulator WTAP-like n=1 Tax=Tubulanus polymorphus TaxID=672921 RepID=UPI003DA59EDC